MQSAQQDKQNDHPDGSQYNSHEDQNDQASNSLTHSFQTVLLIVIESLLTLLLRFDSPLRKCAYPLATKGSLIAICSYLPHDEVYLTFTFKGVLLDSQMPEHKQRADVIVNAHSFEIVNAMLSDKQQAVDKLQVRGEKEQVELFREFLYELSINSFINKSLKRFGKKQSSDKDNHDKSTEVDDESKTDYKLKYTELRKKHHLLKNEKKRLSTEVSELQSRQKFFSILAGIAIILGLLIGCLGWSI